MGLQFRMEGVVDALSHAADEAVDVSTLYDSLRAFAGSEAFADDVTVLSVRMI
jgi:serine phosphatase RsbU (regulator of sigma subunit)